jgi:hypothetical protein
MRIIASLDAGDLDAVESIPVSADRRRNRGGGAVRLGGLLNLEFRI